MGRLLVKVKHRRGDPMGTYVILHALFRNQSANVFFVAADAELTPLGIAQAADARSAWKKELAFDAPLPDKMYSSPLTRALRTHQITFQDVIPSKKTLVVELCREENGVHTCDKRRSRTYIHQTFPLFEIEEGFTEDDELWSPDTRETLNKVMHRAKYVLDAIFKEDREHYVVAITAHGGFIRGFMRVLNRVTGTIPTGGVLPVLVKSHQNCA